MPLNTLTPSTTWPRTLPDAVAAIGASVLARAAAPPAGAVMAWSPCSCRVHSGGVLGAPRILTIGPWRHGEKGRPAQAASALGDALRLVTAAHLLRKFDDLITVP